MMRLNSATHLMMIIGSMALLLIAGFALIAEGQQYFTGNSQQRISVSDLVSRPQAAGLSTSAKQLFLYDCRQALETVALRAQPSATRDAGIKSCLSTADKIVSRMPTFSVGWYSGAFAAALLKDWDGMNARLLRAYLTGANEQWIAILRVELAEAQIVHLDAAVLKFHEQDLRLLLTNPNSVDLIAARAIEDPAFRERIALLVADMPESIGKRLEVRTGRINRRIARQGK